jgi:uncharacterized tellurite resistance protein B-like protein
MLSKIQNWFKQQLEAQENTSQHSIELATAVLLYEVMRADNNFEQKEQISYRKQLEKHFTLSQSELDLLCTDTQNYAEEAADYQQFTRVINDFYGLEGKRAVLDSLWSLAYSDHELSPDEDYTIRKIADLLHIPHSQFIQSKLSIKPD